MIYVHYFSADLMNLYVRKLGCCHPSLAALLFKTLNYRSAVYPLLRPHETRQQGTLSAERRKDTVFLLIKCTKLQKMMQQNVACLHDEHKIPFTLGYIIFNFLSEDKSKCEAEV